MLGKNHNELNIQEEGTIGDPYYNSADCTKAENFFGFTPKHSFVKGLDMFDKKRSG